MSTWTDNSGNKFFSYTNPSGITNLQVTLPSGVVQSWTIDANQNVVCVVETTNLGTTSDPNVLNGDSIWTYRDVTTYYNPAGDTGNYSKTDVTHQVDSTLGPNDPSYMVSDATNSMLFVATDATGVSTVVAYGSDTTKKTVTVTQPDGSWVTTAYYYDATLQADGVSEVGWVVDGTPTSGGGTIASGGGTIINQGTSTGTTCGYSVNINGVSTDLDKIFYPIGTSTTYAVATGFLDKSGIDLNMRYYKYVPNTAVYPTLTNYKYNNNDLNTIFQNINVPPVDQPQPKVYASFHATPDLTGISVGGVISYSNGIISFNAAAIANMVDTTKYVVPKTLYIHILMYGAGGGGGGGSAGGTGGSGGAGGFVELRISSFDYTQYNISGISIGNGGNGGNGEYVEWSGDPFVSAPKSASHPAENGGSGQETKCTLLSDLFTTNTSEGGGGAGGSGLIGDNNSSYKGKGGTPPTLTSNSINKTIVYKFLSGTNSNGGNGVNNTTTGFFSNLNYFSATYSVDTHGASGSGGSSNYSNGGGLAGAGGYTRWDQGKAGTSGSFLLVAFYPTDTTSNTIFQAS